MQCVGRMDPVRLVVLGYASYVLLGWGALCLPWAQRGAGGSWLDHLFTATSAVSTTGLVTVSVADAYSGFGQAVIALLIQLGGIGYMTAGSFTVLAVSGELSPFRRRVGETALSLPQGFDVAHFLRVIVGFTLAIEALGAWVLYPRFVAHGAPHAWWQAVFHSISAFCTAGFGLYNDSLESFRGDVAMNLIVIVLSYLGAIGFIVLADVWRTRRHLKVSITLTSKVILASTFWISVVGTVLFALDEPTVRALPAGERWMASWFQVMTASTTVGFDTVPIGGLSASSLFLLTVVMIIGASPSGTGGGLKTTRFTALWAVMMGVIRRRERTTFLGREIPSARLRAATANLLFYALTLAAGVYALAWLEQAPLPDLCFEAASALGTVGLSRGITATISHAGQGVLIVLMFVGRAGPVALATAFFLPPGADREPRGARREDVAV